MTDFYTVTIVESVPLKVVTGKAFALRTAETVQEYFNCTWEQILFYRKKYLNADITIQMTSGFKDKAKNRVRFADVGKGGTRPVDASKFAGIASKPKLVKFGAAPESEPGYEAPGYGDLVNKLVKESV